MNRAYLLIMALLFQLAAPSYLIVAKTHGICSENFSKTSSAASMRVSRLLYVNLEVLQDANVVFWEAIPQSMQYHVATIDLAVLSIFVSSNARNIRVYRDDIGNLWLATEYTIHQGEFIGTLTWVSSETIEENLTIPDVVPFPDHYPPIVRPFLNAGRMMPTDDRTIKELAALHAGEDMVSTIRNIAHFVNETQTYDSTKIRHLMLGELKTDDILDFLNDPLESLRTNVSFCFERAMLATTLLRAANIPTRTFTNADLKTWVEVWLPEIGWVHAEILSLDSPSDIPLFPRPLSFATIPLMVQNSSDAVFPFMWNPAVEMRIANLTLTDLSEFEINEYGTILCQPIEAETYATDPDKFRFPLFLGTNEVKAALTSEGADIIFHLDDGKREASKIITLGEKNHLEFEGFELSFQPIMEAGLLFLQGFSVMDSPKFDSSVLVLLTIPVSLVVVFWLYRKRKRPPFSATRQAYKIQ